MSAETGGQAGWLSGIARLAEPRRGLGTGIACAFAAAFGLQSVTRIFFAFFLRPMTREFHWHRTEFILASSLAPLTVALLSLPIGRLIDRRGPRIVLVPGMVVFSLLLMVFSLSTPSLPLFAAMWVVFGVCAATQAPTPMVKALSGWYDDNRAMALAVFLAIGGLVGALLPVVIGKVIDTHGWRVGWIVLGGLPLILAFPVTLFLFKDPPKRTESTPGGAAEAGVTAMQAASTLTFWLLFVGTAVHHVVITGVTTSVVAMFGDRGISAAHAGGFVSLMAVVAIAGRLAAGAVLDRFETPRTAILFFGAATIGVFLLHHFTSPPMLALSAVFLGFGMGSEATMEAYMLGRYFGLKAVGQLFGAIYISTVLGAVLGGAMLSASFDETGSYDLGLLISEVLMVLGLIMVLFLGRYRFAATRRVAEPSAAADPAGTATGTP